MAELVVGEKARITFGSDDVLVGRRSDDGSFVPDIDLADLEGGRTVSRRHARVFQKNGQWYIKVEPTITNQTNVGGRALAAGDQALLNDGDEIQLGRVAVIFRAGTPVPETPPPNPDATLIRAVESAAELRSDGQVFPLNAPEGRSLSLGRHSDDKTYHPDVDLGDLPNGRTVSRRHGLLFTRNGQWVLRVEASVTNPTVLDGRQLALGEEAPLTDGSTLQLGRVVVTFHQAVQVAAAGDLIEVILEPPRIEADPGGETRFNLTVINHTGHVDWFNVEIEGLPKSWYKIVLPDGTSGEKGLVQLFNTPLHGKVAPDAVAKLLVILTPPREPGTRAGLHPITASATTQGEPPMRRIVTSQVTISRFEGLALALEPAERRGSRGTYHLSIENQGNDIANISLQIQGDSLNSEWEKPLAPSGITLANGAKDHLNLAARVKYRTWLGMDRSHRLRVTAKSGGLEESKVVDLICPPRIPIWLQLLQKRILGVLAPILMLIAFLGVLAGAYLAFLRPPEIKAFKAEPPSVVVGHPAELSWSLDRAGAVTIEPSSGNEQLAVPDGKLSVSPATTTTYRLIARNQLGIFTSTRNVTVEVRPAPPTPKVLSFTAQPEHVRKEGDEVKLSWQTDGVTKVTIKPDDEVKDPPPSGEATVHPQTNKARYEITATGAEGTEPVIKSVEITIDPPQVAAFSATPESVTQGSEVRLRWTAQNFSKLMIKANKGEVAPGKPELEIPASATDLVVKPLENTEYTITATNAGGSDTKVVKVTVAAMAIQFFKAEPPAIAKGERTTLTWSVPGAASVTIQPGGPAAPGETSRVVQPDQTTEYTLTATGVDGKKIEQKLSVAVGLGAAKVDFFTAAPATIVKGQKATLTYSVQNAKRIVITGSDGSTVANRAVATPSFQGSVSVSPGQTTTYTLTVSNDSGQTASPAVVTVADPTPTPAPTPPPPPPPAPSQPAPANP